jgi:hypothetical protein
VAGVAPRALGDEKSLKIRLSSVREWLNSRRWDVHITLFDPEYLLLHGATGQSLEFLNT